MCYCHDDQWESRSTRVISVEVDHTSGVVSSSAPEKWDFSYPYEYRVKLTCRHVNLKRLDAEGGPPYQWRFYPWNSVARYILKTKEE